MKITIPVRLFLTCCLLLTLNSVFTQNLVKDIDVGFAGSEPSHFVRMDSLTYFIANDGLHGFELWVTDGTELGTTLVKDIAPGVASGCQYTSMMGIQITDLQVLDKSLLFFANDGVHGFELWRSNGTEDGTQMVKDIFPGNISSCVSLKLTKAGRLVYFAAVDALTHGTELWRTDGTDTGTVIVKDLNPGIKDGNPQCFFADSNTLYFSANDGVYGYGIWKTDGTEAGTVYLKNASPSPVKPGELPYAKCKDQIYFSGFTVENGTELWKTNGTPEGTLLVKDIVPGKDAGLPSQLTAFKDQVLFTATTGRNGEELWKSDGTDNGTMLVQDICPGPCSSKPRYLSVLKDKVYMVANDNDHGRELWVTDLTDTGTVRFNAKDTTHHDLEKENSAHSGPQNLFVDSNRIYYAAEFGTKGYELWTTDGTIASTKMLPEICEGNCSAAPGEFYLSDTVLFFAATDETHGRELYRLGALKSLLTQITEESQTVYVDPLRKQLIKMSQTGSDILYIIIFDLKGTELLTQYIKDPIPLSVDSFEKGLYVLRAYDKNDRVVAFARFVKE